MTSMSADALNRITSIVIGIAIEIHKELGPGLLERAYRLCVCSDLRRTDLEFEVENPVPLVYHGVTIDCAYRADLVIEGSVIVEVKAIERLASIHNQQLYTYLKLTGCPVGLILNFGASTMKEGIKRIVNGFPE